MIKSEQIRLKKGTKRRTVSLSQARPDDDICPEGNLRVGMLFEVGLTRPTLESERGRHNR